MEQSLGGVGRKAERHLSNAGLGRALASACTLLLLILGLAGCSLPPYLPEATPTPVVQADPTKEPRPTATLPPGTTPVVFWEPYPLDRPRGLLLGEMVREFEAQNPDILVEIVAKGGYEGIHGGMLAEIPDGELPDLAVAFPSMIAEYAAAGVVIPLEPFVYDIDVGLTEEDLEDIPPGLLESGRLPVSGHQLMAFPFVQNAIGMWVNDSLLSQAGWDHVPRTWAEFEQACSDVAALTGAPCYPFVESVSVFDAWLYSRGGQQLNSAGKKAKFNEPAGVESLALLRRMLDAGLAWRPEQTYGDYVAFANGQAAFTFSSTGNSSLYADAYEGALYNDVPPFRWHQAQIPQVDPENPSTLLYGASFFIVRGDPEREKAAWRLIHWFTDTEQTARWSQDLETAPVRISALGVMTGTLEAHPFVRAQVEEILPFARPEPPVAAGLDVRDIVYTAIISVTQGYADPQTALDQAARGANRVLAGEP